MNVAIIPARGGSRRIPRKNIKSFFGKPIMAYSIEVSKASNLFKDVFVSTEDDEIGKLALDLGAFWLKRPKDLANDFIGTQELMTYHLTHDLDAKVYGIDYACCIYPTAPLLSQFSLMRAFLHVQKPKVDYAFGVGTLPLRDAGQFYFGKSSAFVNKVPLIHESTVMIPLPENRVCDINTMEDWIKAEEMFKSLEAA